MTDEDVQHLMKKKGFTWFCQVDNCLRSTNAKSAMIIHLRRHFGIKPFICDRCGLGFCGKYDLLRHKQTKKCIYMKNVLGGMLPNYGEF